MATLIATAHYCAGRRNGPDSATGQRLYRTLPLVRFDRVEYVGNKSGNNQQTNGETSVCHFPPVCRPAGAEQGTASVFLLHIYGFCFLWWFLCLTLPLLAAAVCIIIPL